jgi:hypothetical protein
LICSECEKEFKASFTQVKTHLKGQNNIGIRVSTDPANPAGKKGKGMSMEKMAKYNKAKDETEAKSAQSNLISELKQAKTLGAASSRHPLHSAESTTPSNWLD